MRNVTPQSYESPAEVTTDLPVISAEPDVSDIIVMKFGGTSVADAERIRRVAQRAVAAHDSGKRVVVVASAMGKSTDHLIELARGVSDTPNQREMDMLLSTGERISCALIAMAIHDLGHQAVSLTGSQAGIVTTNEHTNAKIIEVRGNRIYEALETGRIVLVAGFQGVSLEKDVTTLGRGGSDTTAVAIAAAVGASACEIYTDVDGVFTADPRIVEDARKMHFVSYEEMLEMSASGARVLMLRSAEFARNHGVRLHVRSSFHDEPGTWIGEADERMEHAIISGVTHDEEQARITLEGVKFGSRTAATVFNLCAELGANVDMILQTSGSGIATDIAFTVPRRDAKLLAESLDSLAERIGASGWSLDESVGIVSLVGAGMKTHPGVAAKMFDALASAEIDMQLIATSPIKISCVVASAEVADAVRCLHAAFELGTTADLRDHHEH